MTQKQTATKKVLELIGDSLKKGKNYSLEKEQLKELFDDFGDEILDPMKSKHGEKYIQKLSKEHENLEAFRDYIINRFVSLVAQKSFNEYGMFEEPEGIELFLTLIKTDETDKKIERNVNVSIEHYTPSNSLTKETSSFFRSCSMGLGGGVTPFFLSKATKPDLFKFQKPFIPFFLHNSCKVLLV
ncbi:hypothetical protein [Prochlorococcus marinus]|uniref:hypothetical protein n=1 Tax=Prochlorococcus marinus TaxID=1219 RepID=UPI0022B4F9B3|nr:hypothetical protein [Prochlorococcus marinus]